MALAIVILLGQTFMIIQLRTSRDLLDTMRLGLSPAWKVSKSSLERRQALRVHVVNGVGTQRIEGDYVPELSIEDHPDRPLGRTIIEFSDPSPSRDEAELLYDRDL